MRNRLFLWECVTVAVLMLSKNNYSLAKATDHSNETSVATNETVPLVITVSTTIQPLTTVTEKQTLQTEEPVVTKRQDIPDDSTVQRILPVTIPDTPTENLLQNPAPDNLTNNEVKLDLVKLLSYQLLNFYSGPQPPSSEILTRILEPLRVLIRDLFQLLGLETLPCFKSLANIIPGQRSLDESTFLELLKIVAIHRQQTKSKTPWLDLLHVLSPINPGNPNANEIELRTLAEKVLGDKLPLISQGFGLDQICSGCLFKNHHKTEVIGEAQARATPFPTTVPIVPHLVSDCSKNIPLLPSEETDLPLNFLQLGRGWGKPENIANRFPNTPELIQGLRVGNTLHQQAPVEGLTDPRTNNKASLFRFLLNLGKHLPKLLHLGHGKKLLRERVNKPLIIPNFSLNGRSKLRTYYPNIGNGPHMGRLMNFARQGTKPKAQWGTKYLHSNYAHPALARSNLHYRYAPKTPSFIPVTGRRKPFIKLPIKVPRVGQYLNDDQTLQDMTELEKQLSHYYATSGDVPAVEQHRKPNPSHGLDRTFTSFDEGNQTDPNMNDFQSNPELSLHSGPAAIAQPELDPTYLNSRYASNNPSFIPFSGIPIPLIKVPILPRVGQDLNSDQTLQDMTELEKQLSHYYATSGDVPAVQQHRKPSTNHEFFEKLIPSRKSFDQANQQDSNMNEFQLNPDLSVQSGTPAFANNYSRLHSETSPITRLRNFIKSESSIPEYSNPQLDDMTSSADSKRPGLVNNLRSQVKTAQNFMKRLDTMITQPLHYLDHKLDQFEHLKKEASNVMKPWSSFHSESPVNMDEKEQEVMMNLRGHDISDRRIFDVPLNDFEILQSVKQLENRPIVLPQERSLCLDKQSDDADRFDFPTIPPNVGQFSENRPDPRLAILPQARRTFLGIQSEDPDRNVFPATQPEWTPAVFPNTRPNPRPVFIPDTHPDSGKLEFRNNRPNLRPGVFPQKRRPFLHFQSDDPDRIEIPSSLPNWIPIFSQGSRSPLYVRSDQHGAFPILSPPVFSPMVFQNSRSNLAPVFVQSREDSEQTSTTKRLSSNPSDTKPNFGKLANDVPKVVSDSGKNISDTQAIFGAISGMTNHPNTSLEMPSTKNSEGGLSDSSSGNRQDSEQTSTTNILSSSPADTKRNFGKLANDVPKVVSDSGKNISDTQTIFGAISGMTNHPNTSRVMPFTKNSEGGLSDSSSGNRQDSEQTSTTDRSSSNPADTKPNFGKLANDVPEVVSDSGKTFSDTQAIFGAVPGMTNHPNTSRDIPSTQNSEGGLSDSSSGNRAFPKPVLEGLPTKVSNILSDPGQTLSKSGPILDSVFLTKQANIPADISADGNTEGVYELWYRPKGYSKEKSGKIIWSNI